MSAPDPISLAADALTGAGDYIEWLERHVVTVAADEESPEERYVLRDSYRAGFHDFLEAAQAARALSPEEGTCSQ